MLAYVIIAFELAILYTVFWYVFLREPQPYKIKGNPWGGYSGGANPAESGSSAINQEKMPSFAAFQEAKHEANLNAIYQEWNLGTEELPSQLPPAYEPGLSRAEISQRELIRCQRMGVSSLPEKYNGEKSRGPARFAAQFLAKLGESLNLINVKLP